VVSLASEVTVVVVLESGWGGLKLAPTALAAEPLTGCKSSLLGAACNSTEGEARPGGSCSCETLV
jgi:hypothetical protein